MFNSIEEVHAAIRTMTNEELDQLALLTKKTFERNGITQDQALEILGIILAHSIERSLKVKAKV